jgi:hypothetical protein
MKRSNRRHERGVALIWVVITFTVLLGLVGLALDTARVLLVAHELQNAADASALAGAQWVRTDKAAARAAALAIAAANTAENVSITLPDNPDNLADGKIVLGRFDRSTQTFTPTTSAPNAVKVIACRTSGQNGALPLIFGPIFNVSTSNVWRQAIAMAGGGTGAGLIALRGDKTGLTLQGNSILNVNGGTIVVNSNDVGKAIVAGNGADINGPSINVVGTPDSSTYKIFDPAKIHTGVTATPDPLAFLPAPNWQTMPNRGPVAVTANQTVSLQPGYYPEGISMNNTGSVLNLSPGIYVIDVTKNKGGLQINSGTLNANGVMFYVLGGPVNLTGGTINITGIDPATYTYPSGTEIYEGVSIFQTSTADSTINGNNTLNLQGTLYFRNNKLNLSGTSFGVGNQLIANELNISGGANVTINYDGRNPAAGNRVFLVQ